MHFYYSSSLIICTMTFWLLSTLLFNYLTFYYKCSLIFNDYESLIYFSPKLFLYFYYFYLIDLYNSSIIDYFNFNAFSVLLRPSLYPAIFYLNYAYSYLIDCSSRVFKFNYLFACEAYFVKVALKAYNYAIREWRTYVKFGNTLIAWAAELVLLFLEKLKVWFWVSRSTP